jgi:hypothetical protein
MQAETKEDYRILNLVPIHQADILTKAPSIGTSVLHYIPHHEDVWGSEDIAPPFLILVVVGGESPVSALSLRKEFQYSLDRRMGGPPKQYGCCE